jgi:hypothetical protein
MTTNAEYINILNTLEKITDIGLVYETTPENYSKRRKDLENRWEEFKLCCDWIKKHRYIPSEKEFRKYVQVQTYNSYYLKHLVEKWSGKYISNGAFIVAIRFLDIPYRPVYGTPDISVTLFLKEEATLL